MKKKKRSEPREVEFIRKLKQLSSGLIHLAATLDYQYRSNGLFLDSLEEHCGVGNRDAGLIDSLSELVESVRHDVLVLHDFKTHPINPDAAERIRDMDIPT